MVGGPPHPRAQPHVRVIALCVFAAPAHHTQASVFALKRQGEGGDGGSAGSGVGGLGEDAPAALAAHRDWIQGTIALARALPERAADADHLSKHLAALEGMCDKVRRWRQVGECACVCVCAWGHRPPPIHPHSFPTPILSPPPCLAARAPAGG